MKNFLYRWFDRFHELRFRWQMVWTAIFLLPFLLVLGGHWWQPLIWVSAVWTPIMFVICCYKECYNMDCSGANLLRHLKTMQELEQW